MSRAADMRLLLLTLTLLIVACSAEREISKEQILLQSIGELESRFEEKKLARIVEYVSSSYQDDTGRKLRDIKRAIQLQLMRHKSLYVFSIIKDVKWQDDDKHMVTVQITAAMAGKPMDNPNMLTSIRADMIKFTVDFILEDEIYKVKSATWSWANPADFL
ncbi:MAG: hypothetical protein L3J53_06145 [Proteobacteria bacterium]|nr:hypothetical protein [Pseudomonadota bacterium]